MAVAASRCEHPDGSIGLADAIQSLVDYAQACGFLDSEDRVWAYNTVLEAVGATGPGPAAAWVLAQPRPEEGGTDATGAARADLDALLAVLAEAAVENGAAADSASGRERAAMRIMGQLTPRPGTVAGRFRHLYRTQGPRAATAYFYRLSCDAGSVRRSAIARNISWTSSTSWGELEITINRSKPEKDPRDIAAALSAPTDAAGTAPYPACQLCIENEGYPGRAPDSPQGGHPARQNLRILPIELGGERWGLQYSPYAYFDEHCIVMTAHHHPMHIDRAAFERLLDLVDLFPHYFFGSNADLPIVGGSILAHDHFQGGAHEFPMMRARAAQDVALPGFPAVACELLAWPLSVLRLTSACRTQLLEACTHITRMWRSYSDPEAGIVAYGADGTPHNTVTPIVRRVDAPGRAGEEPGPARYETHLALRCNVASAEHPLGVFHPHEEWHHIKKENIGLIEVMGLAILPPRLADELAAVETRLLEARAAGEPAAALGKRLAADPLTAGHAPWAADVYQRRRAELSPATVDSLIRDEVARVFAHVLEDAGVFKWTPAGRAARSRFLETL